MTKTLHSFLILMLMSLATAYDVPGKPGGSDESHVSFDPAWYESFPAYPEVCERFLKEIGSHPQSPSFTYYLMRKKDGYHVGEISYDWQKKSSLRKDLGMFWSAKSKQYTGLDLPGFKNPEEKSYVRQKNNFEREERFFRINLLYGYKGWYEDVIQELDGKTDLSAKYVYALARAVSEKASDIINPSQFNEGEDPYLDKLSPDFISKALIKEYVQSMKKLTRLMERMDRLDPDYEILVGYPAIKAANDYMDAWLQLKMVGLDKEAGQFLKKGIYPEALVSMGKNFLESCLPNAIVFVNGDNDTYPMHYVQEVEGIRQDVTILNLSLLNLPRYIYYATDLLPEKKRIKLTRERAWYFDKSGSVVPADKNSVFKVDADNALIPPLKCESAEEEIKLRVRGGSYAYYLLQDAAILDILMTNKWERPVYFLMTIPPSSFLGLNRTFRKHGLAARITPYVHEEECEAGNMFGNGLVELDLMYKIVMEKFSYDGIEGEPNRYSSRITIQGNLEGTFYQLANALNYEKDIDRLAKVLQRYFEVFPLNRHEIKPYCAQILAFLDVADQQMLRDQYEVHLREKVQEKLAAPEGMVDSDDNMKGILRYLITEIRQLLEEWGEAFESRAKAWAKLETRFNRRFGNG